MDAPIYNQEGKEVGKVTLPERVFGERWNADLVHQVVVGMEANARPTVAHTKDRSEVRGGGKKPWRQKGTGRARHGSIRSPIWRGGGVTHGPRKEKDYTHKVNKKMRTKALFAALSRKLHDGEILFVDSAALKEPKTKEAKRNIVSWASIKNFNALSKKRVNTALVALSSHDEPTAKSFRNFGNILVEEVRNLNPRDVLKYKFLIISDPKKSVKILEERGGVAKKTTTTEA